jgi:hypothetical protein
MEALGKFSGTTITYVNNEAMSAGAFISATTDEIWFAPSGIIGAAAPVSAGGQDIDATMRQKVVSYLKARMRATSQGKGYRGQVISAMIDADYQLKIDDHVIKDKGELLSLTAAEAAKTYGEPPQPLLSAGTAKDIDDLLAQRFGPGQRTVTTLAVTWSESLAVWLNAISTILLGIGLLAIYIEFKTPGFGVFGVIGIVCLAIVFLGSYVAGFVWSRAHACFRARAGAAGGGDLLFPGRGGSRSDRNRADARLAGVGDGGPVAQRATLDRVVGGCVRGPDVEPRPRAGHRGRPRHIAGAVHSARLVLGQDDRAVDGGRQCTGGGRDGIECGRRRAHWPRGRCGERAAAERPGGD